MPKAHPELMLISAVLKSKNMTAVSSSGVTAAWFHDYGRQWRWIERYVARYGRTPTPVAFKAKWSERLYGTDDIEYCIDLLRTNHTKQGMIELLMEASEDLNDDEDPLSVLSKMHGQLVGLRSDVDGTGSEIDLITDWKEVYEDVVDRAARAEEHGLAGIPTGFPTLDNLTGGIQPSQFWVVSARLGEGKTWTGIRMACAALYSGYRVQYNALEQSRKQIAMRVHAFLSGKYGSEVFKSVDLQRGVGVNLIAYRKFLSSLDKKITSGAFVVNDTSRGRVNALSLAAQIERNSPSVSFVDYITLMGGSSGDSRAREQWQQVASLSADLKGLAMQYNIGMVAMAQINRSGIAGRMPGVEHLSGSDAIGHDADVVMTMRKESEHVMRMKLAKNRHGRDGVEWWCEFKPNTGHFEEISRDQADLLIADDKEMADDH